MDNVFEVLSKINVNDHTEKKNGLTYLSWAWAWAEIKKAFPEATYKIYESENGWNYFSDGKTCWVKTSVTINGIENIEYLPIMDFRNKSIALENVTSMDVNKTIQRSLTKCCARHGLGLYIYAGEDLPESDERSDQKSTTEKLVDPIEEANAKAKVMAYINRHNMTPENIEKICKLYKVESIQKMTLQMCEHYINALAKNGGNINE